jgi:hypothetical protein
MIFLIFLAKDILISSQRYNDFSDNSVLYNLLHFFTSPSTIRLEVKDNSLPKCKALVFRQLQKMGLPSAPTSEGPYFCNDLVMGLYPTHNAVFKSMVIFLRTYSLFSNWEKNIYVLIFMYERKQFVETSFRLLFLE